MPTTDPTTPTPPAFQARVYPWLLECFGATIANDVTERCDRFIEEALELAQSVGWTADRGHALVNYVFGRAKGAPFQEAGGAMVTLAALCLAINEDMAAAGETELARISAPEVIAKIRAKQAAKPTGSALPVATTPARSVVRELSARITNYLSMGGFANPEAIEHDKVRDLLIDCRAEFDAIASRLDREGGRGIYVASRASIPERAAMWRELRASGAPIVSSWIDEDGPGQSPSMEDLWTRVVREVTGAAMLVLYVEPGDFPLKGALVEVGAALAAGIPIRVVAPGVVLEPRSMRPIGSWACHPLVTFYRTVESAIATKDQQP